MNATHLIAGWLEAWRKGYDKIPETWRRVFRLDLVGSDYLLAGFGVPVMLYGLDRIEAYGLKLDHSQRELAIVLTITPVVLFLRRRRSAKDEPIIAHGDGQNLWSVFLLMGSVWIWIVLHQKSRLWEIILSVMAAVGRV